MGKFDAILIQFGLTTEAWRELGLQTDVPLHFTIAYLLFMKNTVSHQACLLGGIPKRRIIIIKGDSSMHILLETFQQDKMMLVILVLHSCSR